MTVLLSIHRNIEGWVLLEVEPWLTRRVCAINMRDIDSRPDPITRAWDAVVAGRGTE